VIERWRASAWIVAPVAAGLLLRLWRLPRQILLFDELHAVRAALALPLARILTTYQMPDNCIPLTALYRVLLDAGVRPSEMTFRLPVLACGLLLLVLAPLAVQRRLGRPAAAAFAWLLALSPMLVLYGRIVRSYMPITLLGFAAAAAFYDWFESGRVRSAVAYVTLAAAAVWFHLGAAPLVLAPLAFAAGAALRSKDAGRPRRWPALAAIAGGAAALLACFLLPARSSLLLLIAEKHRHLVPPWGDLLHLVPLFAGTASSPLAALFWLLAGAGLLAAWRTDKRFAAYTVVLVCAQFFGILVLSPAGLRSPQMLSRYLLICLPWVLLWAALGLARLAGGWGAGSRGIRVAEPRERAELERPVRPEEPAAQEELKGLARPAGLAAAVLLPAALWLFGPLARPTFLHTSFAHHSDFLLFSCEPRTVPESRVPDFYLDLGRGARRGALVEYPWHSYQALRELYAYEPFHRHSVLVATPEDELDDPRLRLHNLVAASPEDFAASPASFVVVHRDYGQEHERVEIHACPGVPFGVNRAESGYPELRLAALQMSRRLHAEWGPPDYADDAIVVWDLDRLRKGPAGSRER
jgi:hypothetical protein